MELNLTEALRYAGVRGDVPPEIWEIAKGIARQVMDEAEPRYTWRMYDIEEREDGFYLPEARLLLTGESTRRMLAECDRAVLMACTLGARFDALLRREQAQDMARAVIMDACGSAWVEAGCDAAEQELAARLPGFYLTDRFSPGYGDLPLEIQPEIAEALDITRRIGVTVTRSLLMNPGKSVTAVIGIADRPQAARIRGCAYCTMKETCALRRGGKRCGN